MYDLSRTNPDIKIIYNKVTKNYKKSLIRSKRKSYDDLNSNNKSKATCKIINHESNNTTKPVLTKLSSNDFNNYFCSVANQIIAELPANKKCYKIYIKKRNFPNLASFFLSSVDQAEIKAVISNLKTSNTVDIYVIKVKLIKTISNVIVLPVTHLINKCFQTGVYPNKLKSRVLPIHIKGCTNNPSNFRPIAIAPNNN